MRFVQSTVSAALLSLAAAGPTLAGEEDLAALCAQAEENYTDMFGHPSADEKGVTVVKMFKYRFCPPKLSVPVGTTVRWVNVDRRTSHSIVLKEEGVPESDRLFPEETFEFTFLSPGDQTYLCGPHWETQEMIGMVSVGE